MNNYIFVLFIVYIFKDNHHYFFLQIQPDFERDYDIILINRFLMIE